MRQCFRLCGRIGRRNRYQRFRIGRKLKFRNVTADWKSDAKFSRMCRLRIIRLQTFPDLGRCGSDDRIGTRVVLRMPFEDGDSQRSLFQIVCSPGQGPAQRHISEARGIVGCAGRVHWPEFFPVALVSTHHPGADSALFPDADSWLKNAPRSSYHRI